MNTTISSNGLSVLPQPKNTTASGSQDAATSGSTAGAAARSDDSVKLTDSALAMQQASSTGTQSPIDTAKVDQIRKSLADGSYKIDSGAIADRLSAMNSQIAGKS